MVAVPPKNDCFPRDTTYNVLQDERLPGFGEEFTDICPGRNLICTVCISE